MQISYLEVRVRSARRAGVVDEQTDTLIKCNPGTPFISNERGKAFENTWKY